MYKLNLIKQGHTPAAALFICRDVSLHQKIVHCDAHTFFCERLQPHLVIIVELALLLVPVNYNNFAFSGIIF